MTWDCLFNFVHWFPFDLLISNGMCCFLAVGLYFIFFFISLFLKLYIGLESQWYTRRCDTFYSPTYRSSLWSSVCSLAIIKLVQNVCIDSIFLNLMNISCRHSENSVLLEACCFSLCLFFDAYGYLNFSF